MGNVLSDYRKQKPEPKKRPSNTLSDYLAQAARGYWERQGKLAQEGLTMADQGARQMREGDPAGALGMFAGPVNYLMSPVSALVPTGEEIDTARDLPEWSKPLARAASHTALLALPGPDLGPAASAVGNTARRFGDDAAITFGAEVPEGVTVYGAGPILRKPGLGRGMADLAGDATDAELAALKARLEAEAMQGGAKPKRGQITTQSYKETYDDGTSRWVPGTLRVNPPKKVFERDMSPADVERLGFDPGPLPKKGMTTASYKETYPDGTAKWVPGILRAKRTPGQSPAPQAGGGAGQTPGPAEGILAYHGSPHTFDKFDMSKIGTGEGNQSYGHGLYFAQDETIARHYKGQVSKQHGKSATIDGRPINWDDPKETAAFEFSRWGGDREAAAEFFERTFSKGSPVPGILRSGEPLPQVDVPGSVYQVRINAKPDEFLDWDRPLSEQPQSVRDALKASGAVGPKQSDWSATGGKVLENMKTDPAFAADMRKKGIKGIRYKDAGSRDTAGGTYNYVVFDDKIIDILKRYGIPMTVGVGGGVVVTGANMPPDIAAQMGGQPVS